MAVDPWCALLMCEFSELLHPGTFSYRSDRAGAHGTQVFDPLSPPSLKLFVLVIYFLGTTFVLYKNHLEKSLKYEKYLRNTMSATCLSLTAADSKVDKL